MQGGRGRPFRSHPFGRRSKISRYRVLPE
ncbi:hypothetical protein LUZ88_11665 [Neisseria gonorrhoeae]|nr:hypothetical protein [Neisseria gonorrhoeae]